MAARGMKGLKSIYKQSSYVGLAIECLVDELSRLAPELRLVVDRYPVCDLDELALQVHHDEWDPPIGWIELVNEDGGYTWSIRVNKIAFSAYIHPFEFVCDLSDPMSPTNCARGIVNWCKRFLEILGP